MRYPGTFARTAPDRPAVIGDDGAVISYRVLDERSNQFAHYLRSIGIGAGDVVAVLMTNNARFYEVAWGARRSGVAFTTINYELSPDVIAHVVRQSKASVLVVNGALAGLVAQLCASDAPALQHRLIIDDTVAGFESYRAVVGVMSTRPVDGESEGDILGFSSGSTGLPKGNWFHTHNAAIGEAVDPMLPLLQAIGADEGSTYLAPSPVYHGAPGVLSMAVHRLGGTVVILSDFTAEHVLAAIERHRITHTMMPPPQFTAMMKLPRETRERYDVSSLRGVMHGAVLCPPAIKKAMIDWWGPIITEFYGGSDVGGQTMITSAQWLQHPGSVGTSFIATVHIVDAEQNRLPSGTVGHIAFGGIPAEVRRSLSSGEDTAHSGVLADTGDLGYLDVDGYLYMVDRAANAITIANHTFYPQYVESKLIEHPKVADVAALAVRDGPHPGVTAIVEPLHPSDATDELHDELLTWCQRELPDYAEVLAVELVERLPRAATGKLYRNTLKERYVNQ